MYVSVVSSGGHALVHHGPRKRELRAQQTSVRADPDAPHMVAAAAHHRVNVVSVVQPADEVPSGD